MQSEEERKAKQRAYYAAHKEQINARQKDYYRRTYPNRRENFNAKRNARRRQQDWYRKNAERIKADRRRWYQENHDQARAKQNERSAEIRRTVLEHYGSRCACCGETEPRFLSIDHINGDGKKHRKEAKLGGGGIYRWLIKNNFPPGFQLLCYNCNFAKGHYGVCPHTERSKN